MRFSVVAASLFAGVAMATSTETKLITSTSTVISCGPEVTNCPGRTSSSSVVTTSVPVPTTTSSVPVVSASPIVYSNSTTPVYSAKSSPVGVVSSSSVSLSTITISTCVPTVIYSTVTVAPSPTSSPAGAAGAAGSTGTISVPHNVTAPTASAKPSQFLSSGASGLQSSLAAAAVAGLTALFFA